MLVRSWFIGVLMTSFGVVACAMAQTTASATTSVAADYCFDCHVEQEGASLVFKNDIHYANKMSCDGCHGGDPQINDMVTSKDPSKGFRRRVRHEEVPLFCSGCHSNAKFMAAYKPNAPTNQAALYERSVHGKALARGDKSAANCEDCHGHHEIRAASDTLSKVNRRNLAATCGQCHPEAQQTIARGRHARNTNCVMCHNSHAVHEATSVMLTGENISCGRQGCHRPNSRQLNAARQIGQLLATLEEGGEDTKEALKAAKKVVHSFNMRQIQQAINNAPKPATKPAEENGAVPATP